MGRTAVKAPPPTWAPAPAGRAVLQRKCACGGSGQECRECQGGALQRKAERGVGGGLIPPLVGQVLSSPGSPLDAATRSSMEAGFGHDFSRIRVHADAPAAESARAVHAHAYSVGSHLVFGQDRYVPQTSAGRQLVAHELAHAVQAERHPAAAQGISDPSSAAEREADRAAERVGQGAPAGPVAAAPAAALHRADDAGSFFTHLFGQFQALRGEDFDKDEIKEYLKIIDTGRIEGEMDSDDKAVQIVRDWKMGKRYTLGNIRRAVLIKELLDGPTTDDDEEAIMEILERSDPPMLDKIFFAGGSPSQKQIAEDVPDDKESQLADFCRRRWVGGIESFRKDQGQPSAAGVAIPLGEPLPKPQPGEKPLEMPETTTHAAPRPGLFEGGAPSAPAPTSASPEAGPAGGPEPIPGAYGPYPAVWQDVFRAALASPAGVEFKAAILPILKRDLNRVTVGEAVGIILSQTVPGFIISYGLAAMSEQQRRAFSDVFATDPAVAAMRPLTDQSWNVAVDTDADLGPRRARTPLFDVDVPQKRPAGGTGLGADLKLNKAAAKTFFKPGEALDLTYTTPDSQWTIDIVTSKDESVVIHKQRLTEPRTGAAITLSAPDEPGIYVVRLVDWENEPRRTIPFKVQQ